MRAVRTPVPQPTPPNKYKFELSEEEMVILYSALSKSLANNRATNIADIRSFTPKEREILCRIADTKTIYGGDNSGPLTGI